MSWTLTRGVVRLILAVVAGWVAAGRMEAADAKPRNVIWSPTPVIVPAKFEKPLKQFQALWGSSVYPIGNGRLGATIYGGMAQERIQFNEDSLWTGDENDTGRYQNFGEMSVTLPAPADADTDTGAAALQYRRELDIERALQTISYQINGVRFKRESFASHPAGVVVFRFSADKKGAYTGAISLMGAHQETTVAQGNTLWFSGKIGNMQLDHEARVMVLNEGGSLTVADGTIAFKDCDSLTLLLDAGTSYLNQRAKGWKQEPPHQKIVDRLGAAAKRSFDDLLTEHLKDYQGLYGRVSLQLGDTPAAIRDLPTNDRLDSYRSGKSDPDLEELLFQHARYLMISSSRPGDLPANLQGVWNTYNSPPWRSDYHSDVNVQMNYWFVDQANLSECFQPLAE